MHSFNSNVYCCSRQNWVIIIFKSIFFIKIFFKNLHLKYLFSENSSSKAIESNPLFNMAYTTELERMQQLAKLVSSMQLVNDHLQIIDSTLFGHSKPEDSYLKELTRIRKEVDNLKQKASLNSSNSSINSSILNKETLK